MSKAAVRLVSTRDLSRDEWLSVRQNGVGGSDAAVAVGLSQYKSPLELWLEKTGRKPADDLSANDAVYWGVALEAIIANVYAEKTGAKVRRLNAVLQHPEYPFMLVNLDRVVSHPTDGSGLLEVKTAGARSEGYWEEGVPEVYQCQVLHQLAVTGKPWADVAVLIGGNDFRIFRIDRDEDKIQALIQLEQQFWQHVIDDTHPSPDGSESSGRALAWMYPSDRGEVLDYSEDGAMNKLFADYLTTRQAQNEVEAREALLKQQLQEKLGDATGAVFQQGKITWRKAKDSSTTDFKLLAAENPGLVAKYVSTKEGSRRFLVQVGK
ncbi:YqaJ viral recombinase family protein [Ferrovum myxofaciens]|uniref:YqaJ viral recombinase family protein n=1 Tax=Ferrovum myxofaciens TaxID=416213 RepID=A0A859A7X3_9PROT|nr:YqaJ viral recombinase family protein [Ferrovum myxofaciens]KXW58051.1 YqaJ-like viral recombinase domain protein [Ferrovum myxofaciens]QKE38162.1 MAG: YqaJ viral recombinase family protein [Ferrovum myxofaciens]QWY75888.1 MAG: YqaJ viral recombinase family protein [Ferrovum myxofaciens]QWY78620.1 MAG: YqaJ viral recombinase family protein [Ferrovum myxofaciens]